MTYDPNDLDPTFADVAAQLSAKFDELAKDKPSDVPSKYPIPPDAGPLKGWAKDSFFDPAVALSGQDLGLIEALYDVITEVWTQTDDGADGFNSGMQQALTYWSGDAVIPVSMYVGNLKGVVDNQQQCLFTLARGLVTYAAIIQKSRESLVGLMHSCVDGWTQAGHTAEAANKAVATAVITAASAIGFTVITSGAGGVTLPAFGSAVMGVAGSITNNGPNLDFGGKCVEIANTFLRGAQELLDETAEAIDRTARPDLDRARDMLPHAPAMPGGILDKGQFHPRGGSPSGVLPPSRINKALG